MSNKQRKRRAYLVSLLVGYLRFCNELKLIIFT